MKVNKNTAELAGIILGDGHMHKSNNSITIVGGTKDFEYYTGHVIPLFYKEFGIKPILRRRNDRNAYYLTLTNKKVFEFFIAKIGLKRGHKRNADIPKVINQNDFFVPPFLRGLFDTDGCLKFSKQAREVPYYPRVQLCFQESPLVDNLPALFSKLGFNYGTWKDRRFRTKYYQISGKENADRWFDEVQPKNSHHIKKYEYWKQNGFYLKEKFINKPLSRKNALNGPQPRRGESHGM
jgi:intein/homing endonuclease